MRPEVREKALQAAARVAMSVGLVHLLAGCGGEVGPNTEAEVDQNATARTASARSPYGKTHAKATCEKIVEARYPSESWLSPDEVKDAPASVKTCCETLATYWDAHSSDPNSWDWPERGACCPIVGWDKHPTCTPWGPPMPPRFRGAVRRSELLC